METLLQVNNLTKYYPNFTLDHISFDVPKGTIMGLIGENGAGKTTTIKAILDLIAKDEGSVTFCGKELSSSPSLKEIIGVVFDEINFYKTLTALQVRNILAAAYTQWDDELYHNYIARFDIPLHKEIKDFSKGMKTKLCIAAALSHKPKILILDEPTMGLDPVVRDDMLDILLEFVQDEDHSVLLSSHITSDLEKIADYITCIHQGKILFTKPKDELRYRWGIIRCGESLFETMDKTDILALYKDTHQINVLVADRKKAQRKYKTALIDSPTLDDILLLYVKGE